MLTRYRRDENGKNIAVARVYTRDEHPIKNDDIDKDALRAIRRITASGQEAYIVGGAVRDLLLGRKPKDFDIGTSMTPNQVKKHFSNARIIGKRFRIVHLFYPGGKIIEVTTFRSDEEYFENGKNNQYGSQEQDAKRRDFSINALYYDPEEEEVIDFGTSMNDLRKGIIRSQIPLSYAFKEDPVRMIRALKFKQVLGFKLKKDVAFRILIDRKRIAGISVSRLTEEVDKILRTGYSLGIFSALKRYGLLRYIFPCLSDYIGYEGMRKSLESIDEYVREKRSSDESISEGEIWAFLLKPIAVFDPEDDYRDAFDACFRQIKVLVNPLTPPNYELAKGVDIVLAENGIKKIRRNAGKPTRKKRRTQ